MIGIIILIQLLRIVFRFGDPWGKIGISPELSIISCNAMHQIEGNLLFSMKENNYIQIRIF